MRRDTLLMSASQEEPCNDAGEKWHEIRRLIATGNIIPELLSELGNARNVGDLVDLYRECPVIITTTGVLRDRFFAKARALARRPSDQEQMRDASKSQTFRAKRAPGS